MAWTQLPTNYTDATWSGLKKYQEITNDDGTVSFQDVTTYINRDNSFFGAKEANAMNAAINVIMAMVENGTDLYTDFQKYFAQQQVVFKEHADNTAAEFDAYVADLKVEGDAAIETIKTDYREEITEFEEEQEVLFNTWFELVKGQFSGDVAGNLQNGIDAATERVILLETMVLNNEFVAPMLTDDDTLTVITDDNGNAILADWKHKEV